MTWLQQNKVQYINDWSPNSPDLNPIEHVWHLLKLRLSLYERKARNIDELWERVDFEWNKLDKDVCRSYIDSMPDPIAAEEYKYPFAFFSVVSLSRRGGRTSGQLSAPYGSRTPSDGDRVSEARIIVSEETTWT
ncbi:hypothetical protein G6F41_013267 [Rhizopus arrhizus]|nr:hypothetical protein G6F41_013267 [Rhizopus arrhizus]